MAFLDSSGVTRLWQHIIAKLGNKVDKETGKGLSTNDYTTTEKNKLAGIAEGANNYTLPVASSTLGGVKTTNTDGLDLLTANGYAPIPIVDGIPYFMPVAVSENSGFPTLTVGNLDLNLPIAMNVGSDTHPVYFLDGYPYETTYTLEASVPANAKFTDTTYTAGNSGIAISAQKIYNKGILSLSQGTTNGTIKYSFFNQQVNNVVTSDLKIKGLDTAAYHPESYFVPATRTINNKALSANISLTASDVGAAASSHTHSYLPLTGGTLTGSLTVNDNIYSKGTLVSQTNSYPGLTIQNASGANLAMLYSDGANGGYSNTGLRVYSSASAYSSFSFGKDGQFMAPNDITAYGGVLKSSKNSVPSIALTNASGAWLAYLSVETTDGSYGNAKLRVNKSAAEGATFTFGNTGNFRAYGTIYGSTIVAQTNNNPQLTLQNNSGANLAMLYANTTTGDYSSAYLRVYSSASDYSTFNFGNDGKLSCGSLALATALPISSGGTGATTASGALTNLGALPLTGGTLTGTLTAKALYASDGNVTGSRLVSQIDYYPDVYFKNATGTTLAEFYVNTTSGGYADVKLKIFSDASTGKYFVFGKDGTFTATFAVQAERTYIRTNNYPELLFQNANGVTLAELYANTTTGAYAPIVLRVKQSVNDFREFTFRGDGSFTAKEFQTTDGLAYLINYNSNAGVLGLGNTTYGDFTEISCEDDGSLSINDALRATMLRVDGSNDWPSLYFKCSSKTNPGVLLQASSNHSFGIYCYGSDLDNASTRYFEGYTFPAPATGLTANKSYTVYSEKNIIYSSSQPTGVKGAIWLKPV